ncbi:hypothetical protein Sste5346_009726 [Sporothrix stenoceras]|uniref:NECAP PHear domain-containing protein n=1 Tax=Sporothrix stenoceras TaxID=5173 RepID=A0ABR3YIN2_9PEZI
MSAIDPVTGQPLPANAIQRILFIGPKVHVYQIPPLTSTKGYTAATWTEDPKRHIFTARLRVLETGVERDDDNNSDESTEDVKVDVILEDPANGQLFAAAPYTEPSVIESALDSSRFFAVRVQDGQGRRAVLGIGFEERPDAFDFGVALQEARKTVRGFAEQTSAKAARQSASSTASAQSAAAAAADKKDYSLKDGETITINLGGSSKFGRRSETSSTGSGSGGLGGFSLPPPPSSSSSSSTSSASSAFSLPPPPPPNRRTANRRSVGDPSVLGLASRQQATQGDEHKKSAAELGFDDGQFGEFA